MTRLEKIEKMLKIGGFHMTPEDIQKELADYKFVMEQVREVYYTLTNGRLSKPNHDAATVISEIEEIRQQEISDALKEAAFEPRPDLLALQARIHQLEAALRKILDGETPDFHGHYRSYRLNTIAEALEAPTPDTSPLWGVLGRLNGMHAQHKKSLSENLAKSCACPLCLVASNALTPSLRALIAEMSGRF